MALLHKYNYIHLVVCAYASLDKYTLSSSGYDPNELLLLQLFVKILFILLIRTNLLPEFELDENRKKKKDVKDMDE